MRRKNEMNNTTETITLEEGIDRWIIYCRRRGLTENTLRYYKDITEIFMKHVNYKTNLSSISKYIIDDFIMQLQNNGVKSTTINSYLNGIRSICNWLASEGYFKTFKITKIKCDEEIKDTFSPEEIKLLIKKPNLKKCTFLQYECYVMCNMFYAVGARASTITWLKIEDIDLENGYFTYKKVKDRKQTIIPMTNSLIPILEEFLIYRKGEKNDYLFVNSYSGKLTTRQINTILNNYYKSKGVTKSSVHIWRRSFAKDYIIAGGSPFKLQSTLCHKTLDMTKKYVSLYGKDIRDDEHNPLELITRSKHIKMDKGGRK